jgi:hypothetical protein
LSTNTKDKIREELKNYQQIKQNRKIQAKFFFFLVFQAKLYDKDILRKYMEATEARKR